ncbi:hypothetical protein EWM64_g1432, partial [Hericium alpestre]
MLLLIYNPVSGPSSGAQITQGRVLPLLTSHGRTPDLVAATEHIGHAGQIAVDTISKADNTDERITVVLISGDGTLHEVVEALHAHYATKPTRPKIGFVLRPRRDCQRALFLALPGHTGRRPDTRVLTRLSRALADNHPAPAHRHAHPPCARQADHFS